MVDVLVFVLGVVLGTFVFNVCIEAWYRLKYRKADRRGKMTRLRLKLQMEELERYRRDGTRPTSLDCAYNDKGEMVWNELTGCCGPATHP